MDATVPAMSLYDGQAGHLLASKNANVRRLRCITLLFCFAGTVLGNIPRQDRAWTNRWLTTER